MKADKEKNNSKIKIINIYQSLNLNFNVRIHFKLLN